MPITHRSLSLPSTIRQRENSGLDRPPSSLNLDSPIGGLVKKHATPPESTSKAKDEVIDTPRPNIKGSGVKDLAMATRDAALKFLGGQPDPRFTSVRTAHGRPIAILKPADPPALQGLCVLHSPEWSVAGDFQEGDIGLFTGYAHKKDRCFDGLAKLSLSTGKLEWIHGASADNNGIVDEGSFVGHTLLEGTRRWPDGTQMSKTFPSNRGSVTWPDGITQEGSFWQASTHANAGLILNDQCEGAYFRLDRTKQHKPQLDTRVFIGPTPNAPAAATRENVPVLLDLFK